MPNDPFVDVGDLRSFGPLRYLDVRDQATFDPAHAPGAVRVPLDEWDAAAKAADAGFAKTAYQWAEVPPGFIYSFGAEVTTIPQQEDAYRRRLVANQSLPYRFA